MIRYFLRLQSMPDSRLTKRIFLYDLSTSKLGTDDFWSTEVQNILIKNYLGHQFYNPGHEESVINSLTNSLLSSDRAEFTNGCLNYPKLRTYVKIADFSQNNSYLFKPLSLKQKSFLAKFKLGTLPLRLETDRYIRPPVPEKERICCHSLRNEIENEIHFALYCTKHQSLRETLFLKIGKPPDEMSDFDKLRIMLSDPNIVKIFSQFIIDCYDNRS